MGADIRALLFAAGTYLPLLAGVLLRLVFRNVRPNFPAFLAAALVLWSLKPVFLFLPADAQRMLANLWTDMTSAPGQTPSDKIAVPLFWMSVAIAWLFVAARGGTYLVDVFRGRRAATGSERKDVAS